VAAALRLERPARSAAQIADILTGRHGVLISERTLRERLQRQGLQRAALTAETGSSAATRHHDPTSAASPTS
jgi:hypothetical protein